MFLSILFVFRGHNTNNHNPSVGTLICFLERYVLGFKIVQANRELKLCDHEFTNTYMLEVKDIKESVRHYLKTFLY